MRFTGYFYAKRRTTHSRRNFRYYKKWKKYSILRKSIELFFFIKQIFKFFIIIFFWNQNSSSFQSLIEYLKDLSVSDDEKISIGSSICIGKLGVKDCKIALDRLIEVIQTDQDWYKKSLALEALVRLFDAKDSQTIGYILNQIENSTNWISRSSALKLLSYLGF